MSVIKRLFPIFIIFFTFINIKINCNVLENNITLNTTETNETFENEEFEFPKFFTPDDNLNSIIILSDGNYTSYFESEEEIYLFFYLPECQHCHNFKPEFIKTADYANKKKLGVKFCFIDATLNPKMKEEYNVENFPTVFLVLNKTKYEYKAVRNEKYLIRFYERMKNGPIKNLKTLDEIIKLQKENPFLFISTIKDKENSKLYGSFKEYSTQIMKYEFVDCISEECFQKFATDDLILMKNFDEKVNSYKKDFEPLIKNDNITNPEILISKFYGMFGVECGAQLIDDENILDVFLNNKKVLFYFRDGFDIKQTSKDIIFKELGQKVRNKNIYTLVSDVKGVNVINEKVASVFLIQPYDLPAFFFYDLPEDGNEQMAKSYRKNKVNLDDITLDNLLKFLEDIKTGKIKRDLFSEPFPINKEINGLKIFIGHTYDEEVIEEKRNVAILLVGADFENGQKYLGFFEILAAKYKNNTDIVFGFLDMTQNEPRDIEINPADGGKPMVYLYTNAMKEKKVIKFESKIAVENVTEVDIDKFIVSNLGWKYEEEKKDESDKDKNKKNKVNEEL